MIDRVNERLVKWAEQCVGGLSRSGGSVLGAMIDCPPAASVRHRRRMVKDETGRRAALPSAHGVASRVCSQKVVALDSGVMDTSQAVAALPKDLREVVHVFYFEGGLAVEVRARKLSISRMTMYRRLEAAHVLIDSRLYGTELPKIS